MKKALLIIFILTNFGRLFSQTSSDFHLGYNPLNDPIKYGKANFIIGYERTRINLFEIGVARGSRGYEGYSIYNANYHLTTEHISNNNQYLLGSKVGFKASALFFDFTTDFIYYTNFKNSFLAFRPEIGISFFGLVDLNYGYKFNLQPTDFNFLKGHILSARITLGKNIQI